MFEPEIPIASYLLNDLDSYADDSVFDEEKPKSVKKFDDESFADRLGQKTRKKTHRPRTRWQDTIDERSIEED